MELKLDEIKAALIRLQGQVDVWTTLYKAAEEAEKAKNDSAPKA